MMIKKNGEGLRAKGFKGGRSHLGSISLGGSKVVQEPLRFDAHQKIELPVFSLKTGENTHLSNVFTIFRNFVNVSKKTKIGYQTCF